MTLSRIIPHKTNVKNEFAQIRKINAVFNKIKIVKDVPNSREFANYVISMTGHDQISSEFLS